MKKFFLVHIGLAVCALFISRAEATALTDACFKGLKITSVFSPTAGYYSIKVTNDQKFGNIQPVTCYRKAALGGKCVDVPAGKILPYVAGNWHFDATNFTYNFSGGDMRIMPTGDYHVRIRCIEKDSRGYIIGTSNWKGAKFHYEKGTASGTKIIVDSGKDCAALYSPKNYPYSGASDYWYDGVLDDGCPVPATPPAISFGGPFTLTVKKAASIVPTSTGGVIASCALDASSPALPSGLSVANNCSISGTPSATKADTKYTVKASNSAGTVTASVNIKVDPAPVIPPSYPSCNYVCTTGFLAFANQSDRDSYCSGSGPVIMQEVRAKPSKPSIFDLLIPTAHAYVMPDSKCSSIGTCSYNGSTPVYYACQ